MKPFALDDDGTVRVVGPPGLQRFLEVDESDDEREDTEPGRDR
ncbi:MAG: hypothetical protein ACOCY1_04845 [Halovenus sp.]